MWNAIDIAIKYTKLCALWSPEVKKSDSFYFNSGIAVILTA